MPTRILVPTDFSERSAEATRYAAAIADHYSAELLLAHVAEPVLFDYAMVDPSPETTAEAAETRRGQVKARLESFAASALSTRDAERLLLEGDPADQILCASRKHRADLIVMPTQGRSRVRQFLIGSVTAKVLHDAAVPVWTGVHIHQNVNFPEFRLSEILCAIDFGSQTGAVVRYATQLATEFHARLTVQHVASGSTAGIYQRMEALLNPLRVEASIRVDAGEPHKVVAASAGQLHADVVVIGRACSTGMMGRLREQAYGIVRDSPCPVLSV